MSLDNSKSCYIPLTHNDQSVEQIKLDDFITIVKKFLEDPSILKIGQNIKYDFIILANLGIMIKNIDDTMLMSYVLKTGNRGHNLDELALDYLSHSTIKFTDVTNVNKKKISFQDVDIKSALKYAAEDSDVTYRLWEILKIELIKNKLYDFYFFC